MEVDKDVNIGSFLLGVWCYEFMIEVVDITESLSTILGTRIQVWYFEKKIKSLIENLEIFVIQQELEILMRDHSALFLMN